ncbi:MAG: stage III sporulation protein AG [Firmicutes bacterium]|jgi:stage III sporulation protein AG|nr:stage III sporulation protein AG [Bacillota bacterium]
MQLRDLWDKWWPEKTERSGVPLTDQQRRFTGFLLILILAAALMLQVTSQRGASPVTSPLSSSDSLNGDAEPALGGRSASSSNYEEEIERKLAAILSRIEGVGSVEVMVTFSTGSRLELAQDVNGDETVTEETDTQGGKRRVVSQRWNEKVVILREGQRGDSPIILAEHRPVVAGVLVVADGAKDPGIRLLISRAVETAIDIPSHRVTVVPRKK